MKRLFAALIIVLLQIMALVVWNPVFWTLFIETINVAVSSGI
ncbi:MAG: hypothetical protein AAGD17_11400 [Bacteroidota bacterium]